MIRNFNFQLLLQVLHWPVLEHYMVQVWSLFTYTSLYSDQSYIECDEGENDGWSSTFIQNLETLKVVP